MVVIDMSAVAAFSFLRLIWYSCYIQFLQWYSPQMYIICASMCTASMCTRCKINFLKKQICVIVPQVTCIAHNYYVGNIVSHVQHMCTSVHIYVVKNTCTSYNYAIVYIYSWPYYGELYVLRMWYWSTSAQI